MHFLNPKMIVMRLVIIAILAAFVYPFLPDKQQWEIKAAFGDGEADSLLSEFYEPPVDGALQFALEVPFAIRSDSRELISRRDIRYVELGDKLWNRGKQWMVHIRRSALARLTRQLEEHPAEHLWVELDYDWKVRLDLAGVRSPLYIDPLLFSDDPNFPASVLEPWYPGMM